MQRYQQALYLIEKAATRKMKANALLKVAAESHDSKLAELCRSSAKMYLNHLKPGQARSVPEHLIGIFPRTNTEWRDLLRKANHALREYAERCIAEQKPGWQVEAERRGWQPPVAE